MIKWKLMLTTMPYVLVAVALRLILDYVLKFHGVVEFTDVGMVLTGGVFLIGVMLAGTMSDYKESEKLPAEVACVLETMEETVMLAAVTRPAIDTQALQRSVFDMTNAILERLVGKLTPEQLFEKIEGLNWTIHELEKAGAPILANRFVGELQTLRRHLSRMDVISRTNFLATGYALLETVVVVAVMLMLMSKYKSPIAEYTLVSFVTLIFVYMVRLIKDTFQHSGIRSLEFT